MSDCIEWTGFINSRGYGQFSAVVDGRRTTKMAHRAAWERANNAAIPPGHVVLHLCDNTTCVNPEHLQVGTQADNIRDMDAKGRRATFRGEANGRALLTEADVRAIRASTSAVSTLATEYGLTTRQIRNVRLRLSWRHVN